MQQISRVELLKQPPQAFQPKLKSVLCLALSRYQEELSSCKAQKRGSKLLNRARQRSPLQTGGLEAIVIVGGDKVLLGKSFSLLSENEYCVTQNRHTCSVVCMNSYSVFSDKEGWLLSLFMCHMVQLSVLEHSSALERHLGTKVTLSLLDMIFCSGRSRASF